MAETRKLNSDFNQESKLGAGAKIVTKEEADDKLTEELYRVPDSLKVCSISDTKAFILVRLSGKRRQTRKKMAKQWIVISPEFRRFCLFSL